MYGWSVSSRGTDFFISHAGRDTGWAEWLARQLRQAGCSVELDVWDWAPGEDFVASINPGAVQFAWTVEACGPTVRFAALAESLTSQVPPDPAEAASGQGRTLPPIAGGGRLRHPDLR